MLKQAFSHDCQFIINFFKCISPFFPPDLLSPNIEHCTMEAISPLTSPSNLLQQTEDQIPLSLDNPFVNLLPPLIHEDYLLSLGEEEGISDLFDAYELEKLPSLEDFMCS